MTEGLPWWRRARLLETRVMAEQRADPVLWKVVAAIQGWVSYFVYPFVYRRADLVRAIPPESAVVLEAQREAERKKLRSG